MHPTQFARSTPDKAAYVMAETGEVVTYRQLDERSNQGAHLFRSRGLVSGDCIAILMVNDARFLEVVWAAQRSGLYYVCIPSRMTERELVYMLTDSNARLLIASSELLAVAEGGARAAGIELLPASGPDGLRSFVAERGGLPTTPIADEKPGQDLLYSSGTTGFPKGIKRALPVGAITDPMPVTVLGQTLYGMNETTVFLSPAPLYHAAPLRFCLAVCQVGGTAIVMEKFDALHALELIERHSVTHSQWVPTHFIRMLKLPTQDRERFGHASLRCAFHAAAPCPVDIKQQMIDWWGPIVHEYYSSTELNGLTAVTAEQWLVRPGTVGQAIIGTVRICDADGEPLPPRQEGLVYFEGGNAFSYHNNPEATDATRNRHGWTTVGDIGWVDESGFLYLTDRQSFMIISGGVNIYPQEIENLLVCHPEVADVGVIGLPDSDFGERVVAIVQPADAGAAGTGLAERLSDYARANLAAYKVPKEFIFRSSLPREQTGKLLKKKLVEEFRQAAPAAY